MMRIEDENNGVHYEGYCVDLIEEIRKLVGFEYEIYVAPDNKFGNMDENGQWNGMMKELIEKVSFYSTLIRDLVHFLLLNKVKIINWNCFQRADIGLGSLSVMAERENVIDFTVPYYDLVGITILMKKPKTPTSLFKFLTVLEHDVWLCILAAYFFTR